MYLHLGDETAIITSSIIGVFDIENTSVSKHTKEFLSAAEKIGNVVNVNYDMPKSFAVCEDMGRERVYISPISTATIKKRFLKNLSE